MMRCGSSVLRRHFLNLLASATDWYVSILGLFEVFFRCCLSSLVLICVGVVTSWVLFLLSYP